MAKNIGLVGGFVGRFGNAVGYTNRGRQLIRVYQPKVFNPNTKRQLITRERFKLLNMYAREGATALNIGFNKVLPGFTRQSFIGLNMNLSTFTDPTSVEINARMLKFSDGPLPSPSNATPTAGANNTVSVPISGDEAALGYDADGTPMYVGVVIVVVNTEILGLGGERAIVTGTAMGSQVSVIPSSVSASVPGSWSGTSCNVYAFFKQSAVPLNGIPAAEWPWRTPFNASKTNFMGTVEIV